MRPPCGPRGVKGYRTEVLGHDPLVGASPSCVYPPTTTDDVIRRLPAPPTPGGHAGVRGVPGPAECTSDPR